ncbi:aldehyde dehydrogenase family protein [Streptomyces malaysiensis]|uniref:Aldehyde dehydrogenase n=1 Tax=Streptomyces malaysiensis TaxID=92644 RepID=A0A7X5X9Y1_STRMQ|nr:aldehyde dehydrogenase family protein [Streptomyces malaysiensis]NIY69364.1 aldehyde dehydrogenase [Streptomyces malaysiensis]
MPVQLSATHWINGEWITSPQERPSFDPATGEQIGVFYDGGAYEAQAAVDAAAHCFETSPWRWDPMTRATVLSHLADAFDSRLDGLVASLCRENGKLRREADYEVHHIVRALRFASGLALQNFGRVADTRPGLQNMTLRQPAGVVGVITPWNSPAYLSIRSLAPALAAGCTAVVKMPAQAAQTAALVAEILSEVPELPRGAVNMFIESGADGARVLVDSPTVPVISFTGSTHTGRLIAQAAAKGLKRTSLELGGKTPHLVFDDADLEAALPVLVRSLTVFAGQFCMTGSRVLVHRAVSDKLTAMLASKLEGIHPGPAADTASDIGPLIDQESVVRVDALVEEAISEGAKPIVRGGPSTHPELADGAFYHPTLLAVPDSSLSIVQQEIFGPVQTVEVFDTEEEAIALANNTEYGLSACIWSRDTDRTIRVARHLEAGLISVNSWANLAIEFEEGGFKSSGLGRLGGIASLDEFTEYKQISQNYS